MEMVVKGKRKIENKTARQKIPDVLQVMNIIDRCIKDYKRKIIIQENSEHRQIGEYLGIDNAAKELKMDRTVIERSIRFKRITKRGYYWKFKDP